MGEPPLDLGAVDHYLRCCAADQVSVRDQPLERYAERLLAALRATLAALDVARPFVLLYGTAGEQAQVDAAYDGVVDAP